MTTGFIVGMDGNEDAGGKLHNTIKPAITL
jgi:hypothetical protein